MKSIGSKLDQQTLLDTINIRGLLPIDVHDAFWDLSYGDLTGGQKRNLHKYIKNATGQEPNKLVKWEDLAEDLIDNPEYLSMIQAANENFGVEVVAEGGEEVSTRTGEYEQSFRQRPEITQSQIKTLSKRNWGESINDIESWYTAQVNAWLDGDDTVDINQVRKSLNWLNEQLKTEDGWNRVYDELTMGNAVGKVPVTDMVNKFIEEFDQLTKWADRVERGVEPPPELSAEEAAQVEVLEKYFNKPIEQISDVEIEEFLEDRLKIKRTEPSTTLHTMIPINEIPNVVHDLIAASKDYGRKLVGYFAKDKVKAKDLFRNLEIWDKTGFWLDRDFKWRYEIDPGKINISPEIAKGVKTNVKLPDILDSPKLYEAVPKLKDTNVVIDYGMSRALAGYFEPITNTIRLSRSGNEATVHHELQHAVDGAVGSKFTGTSVEEQKGRILLSTLYKMRTLVKDPEVKNEVHKSILLNEKLISKQNIHTATKDIGVLAFQKNKEDYKIVGDLINEFYEVDPKKLYYKDPGEMNARLNEIRSKMTSVERKMEPPWVTLDKMLRKEGYSTSTGTLLHSGIPISEIVKLFKKPKPRPKPLPPDAPEPFAPANIKLGAREEIMKRRAGLDLSNYGANKFVNSINQRTTKQQREVIPFIIEGTDVPKSLGRPELEKVRKRDIEKLKPIVGEINQWFETSWKNIKEVWPDLTVKQVDDYITHLWDIPKHKKAEARSWFRTQSQFLERRFIDTIKSGVEKGFIPKTLDIGEIIKVNAGVTNRAIENTKYIKALLKMKDNGIHLVMRSNDAPMDYVEVDYPALTRRLPVSRKKGKAKGEFVKEVKVKVHPDLVRPLEVVFGERFTHPVIAAYEVINGVMKKSMLSINLFHHGSLFEVGVGAMGLLPTLNIYFNPVKIYKEFLRGNLAVFNKEPIARDSIQHGMQYGATSDIPVNRIQNSLNNIANKSKNVPIAGRAAKLLAAGNELWDRALWDYLHDTIKLTAYESLVSGIDPKTSSDLMVKKKREIAQWINDTAGGQNWDNLLVTPKELQMMTWSLLSADWTVSTTRQALGLVGIGSIYKETRWLRIGMAYKYWLRAALYFGVGMTALNVMFREWDMKENPHLYPDAENWTVWDKGFGGNTIGKKTYLFEGRYKDGSERVRRWGKQFRDFFELLVSPFQKIGGKAAPVPQLMSEVLTGHSLSGYRNDDIAGTKGWEKTLGRFKAISGAFLPLSVRQYLKEGVEFVPMDIAMQSGKGMSRYGAIEFFKDAIVDQDEELLRDAYVGALRNNLPAYTLFTSALSIVEAEATASLRDAEDKIADVKEKLDEAKSPKDKKRYAILLKGLYEDEADRKAGLKLFRAALTKLRMYEEPEQPDKFKLPRLPWSR